MASASVAPRSSEVPSTADPVAHARAAFERGVEHFERGEYASATLEFESALSLKETPGLYFHLGMSLLRAGKPLRARAALRAAATFEGSATPTDVAAALPTALDEVERSLAHLSLRIAPDNAVLSLDGTNFDGTSFELDPGAHHLKIVAAGYEPEERELLLRKGEQRQETVTLRVASQRSPAREGERRASEHSARGMLLWSTGLTALAGSAAAIAGFSMAQVESDKARELSARIDATSGGSSGACLATAEAWATECGELSDAVSSRALFNTVGFVGLGVFGAGAIGWLATTVLWDDVELQASPEVGGGRAGLKLSGTF
jgi:hypothetical protein